MKPIFVFMIVCSQLPLFGQNVPAGSHNGMLNTATLADALDQKFKNKCIGYQFVISYKDKSEVERAWGRARRQQDAPARDMTDNDRYNIASVSKPITGAALMKILDHLSGINIDSKIYTFLPSHWHVDNTVKIISFRDLLTHTSGFRAGAETYADLKAMIKAGINPADHGVDKYQNCNYALMRLLIPRLAGYSIAPIPATLTGPFLTAQENLQAASFAIDYMDYVQKKLFTPVGLGTIQCKPPSQDPALTYQFPATNAHGGDYGDFTLHCGSGGWNMSTKQLSKFFSHLHYTNEVWSDALNNYMKKLCYEIGTTPKGVGYYEKEGFIPGSINPGELNSVIVGFENGIIVVVIANSQAPTMEDTIRAAFDAWYH